MNVDELVVQLKLDPSNFSDDQKKFFDAFKKTNEEMEKRLKALEAQNKKVGHSFGDMTSAAEGLFTTIAGAGLAAFARDTVNTAAATGRMATNIGIATNELSSFGRMIERNGGNAEAAAGSLKSYADQVQRAKWGQASPEFLTGLSQVGGGLNDDPLSIFFKLAKFADKNSAQETNLAGARLGLSQDVINSALKGSTKALDDYKRAADGALSQEQTEKLTRMQNAWEGLGQTVKTIGTDLVSGVSGPFSTAAEAVSNFTTKNRLLADSLAVILASLVAFKAAKPIGWVMRLLGLGGVVNAGSKAAGIAGAATAGVGASIAAGGLTAGPIALLGAMKSDDLKKDHPMRTALRAYFGMDADGNPLSASGGSGKLGSKEKESLIRAEAVKLGIDPNIAMAVAHSEGFDNFKSTIPGEQSFGAFQLHVTPGGRGNAVGDQFQKATGLDPSDPRNEAETIKFGLAHAKKHGWSDFHGAKRVGIGNQEGISVGTMNVQVTGVKDAKDFADKLPGAIASRSGTDQARVISNNANSGQRP